MTLNTMFGYEAPHAEYEVYGTRRTLHVVFQKTCKTILFLACRLSGSHLRAKIKKSKLALSTFVQLRQLLLDKL